MADSTEHKTKMNRDEFADFLRKIADQFEGDGEMDISVGNKKVQLHPPDRVKSEIEVVERSSILRGNRESLELDVNWKVNK
ncbi:amphi-Trp domain-containing protein [Halogranum amylolyticum]|uniref:Amphi-Trp domain-containing protein n=1 Tax=Halogranum amylolyticum TaxID=660520 RepID=A0A1H8RGF1_9EURY|nr:amphi-Trp domain-containing protein [Halogranum amylolyticum]SEO65609.1 amphi-Trp domain-containing protein [Halogranum amylolyticum]